MFQFFQFVKFRSSAFGNDFVKNVNPILNHSRSFSFGVGTACKSRRELPHLR